jgi:hypothetical protein
LLHPGAPRATAQAPATTSGQATVVSRAGGASSRLPATERVPYDRPGFVHVTHGRSRPDPGRPGHDGGVAGNGLLRGARAQERRHPAGRGRSRARRPSGSQQAARRRARWTSPHARRGRRGGTGGAFTRASRAGERWAPLIPARRSRRGPAPGSLLILSVAGRDIRTGRLPGSRVPGRRRAMRAPG